MRSLRLTCDAATATRSVKLVALADRGWTNSGGVVVVLVTGDTVEWQLGRALGAAADVATWDHERLVAVHDDLEHADPDQSPALVLVAGGYDPRALMTIEWLSGRHGVPVSAYAV